MRTLGIDFGEKRIGVAVSDPLGWTAQGVTVLDRSTLEEDLARIRKIVVEKDVQRIVVGLPLNMDGSEGPKAREVRTFVAQLLDRIGVPVETIDERLSTVAAERAMLAADLTRKRRRGRIDRIAAQILLQTWLDRHRRGAPPKGGA